MFAIPAVDIRDGACVQLVGGAYDQERVRLDDPVATAQQWEALGFRHLHLVDLDAATGRGSNRAVVRDVLAHTGMIVQVGGGIATTEGILEFLDHGAARVVVGTRAIEDATWLEEATQSFPGRLIVAADVRDAQVVTRGWNTSTQHGLVDVLQRLNDLPIAAVLVTAVHQEGRMAGPDLPLIETGVHASKHPLYASGGIATLADLRQVAQRGVAAAVIGMALYAGALDPRAVAEEFGGTNPANAGVAR